MKSSFRVLLSAAAVPVALYSALLCTNIVARVAPPIAPSVALPIAPLPTPPWKQPPPSQLPPNQPQPTIWQPPRLVLPARLDSRVDSPIQLKTLRITGEVNGRQAITEIDMSFFNPNNRVLEGELQFPLLDGQRVASFAMDVNGAMREAVPVEKAKGQAVFEDVIRGRIDPGLLEITQGNNFKLRVYPIPSNGVKRVVIRVAQTLDMKAGRALYQLPIGFAERVGTFTLNVQVNGIEKAPEISRSSLGDGLGNIAFSRETFSTRFRLNETRSNFAGLGTVDFLITPSNTAAAVQTEFFEGKNYFVVDIPVPTREAARDIPKTVGILWDSSASARIRVGDGTLEAALLDAYFKKMGNGDVKLTRIRDAAEAPQSFRIVNGDWSKLREALAATAYDGATNLGAFVPDLTCREYLLFSDGLSNFGEQPFAKTNVPLYAISAATKADNVFLKHIAQRSGGRYIDLTKESGATAATLLLSTATRITNVGGNGATQLVMASPFPQGGRLQLAGVLGDSQTTLRLNFQHPDGRAETVDVPVVSPTSVNKENDALNTAASTWAQLRVNDLDAEFALNRAEIKRLGQRFGLVTRETSLIILDRVEDYARFEIQPPAELRLEFDRIVGSINMQRRADRSGHLETIVRAFQQKVTWWEHVFPKDVPFKAEGTLSKSVRAEAPAAAGNVIMEDRQRRSDSPRLARDAVREMAVQSPVAMSAASPPLVSAAKSAFADASPAAPQALRMQAENKNADARGPSQPAQSSQTAIRLQKWQPDAPYADRLRSASTNDLYRVYLDEAPSYLNSTAFYLDAADVFFDKGMNDLGVRVLSNLAEMDLENRHILRILGYRLMQANRAALAIPVFKKVLALSPEEPQSYRDLGLAYAADKQPQRAVDSLYEVVVRPWHGRFPEIELIALADMNAIIATNNARLDTSRVDPRLLKNLALDLRAVLTWDADNTDIDLWVTDPNGEKAYYGHRFTYQGGRMSLDFTGGYGPEEFSLKSAKPGKYKIEAQYFGDRRQNITGATTLQVRLTTGFGTRQQKEQIVTMRLKDNKSTILVGEFEVKGGR